MHNLLQYIVPLSTMFFSEKIQSIRPSDRVLEIGPGSTPHSKAHHFLDFDFNNQEEKIRQRGGVKHDPKFAGRPVSYYSGEKFPFEDGQFDYVICSHVIEHVENPESFLKEIFRVGGGRGYIEFPLPPYEYLYDFDVHKHFVWFDVSSNTLNYIRKIDTTLSYFERITSGMRQSLVEGWDDLIALNKKTFFFGIEFETPFAVKRMEEFDSAQNFWKGGDKTWCRMAHAFVRKIERGLARLFC